jgi:hypothetical protein
MEVGPVEIKSIVDLVASQAGRVEPLAAEPDMHVSHSLLPPGPADEIERVAGSITLPSDVLTLWSLTGGLDLFKDVEYGQWGLHVGSPAEALAETAAMCQERDDEDIAKGDLAVGTFYGDLQRVIVRCDPDVGVFGSVRVALPLRARNEWPQVGTSLADFLSRFMESGGDQFWNTSDPARSR